MSFLILVCDVVGLVSTCMHIPVFLPTAAIPQLAPLGLWCRTLNYGTPILGHVKSKLSTFVFVNILVGMFQLGLHLYFVAVFVSVFLSPLVATVLFVYVHLYAFFMYSFIC